MSCNFDSKIFDHLKFWRGFTLEISGNFRVINFWPSNTNQEHDLSSERVFLFQCNAQRSLQNFEGISLGEYLIPRRLLGEFHFHNAVSSAFHKIDCT